MRTGGLQINMKNDSNANFNKRIGFGDDYSD